MRWFGKDLDNEGQGRGNGQTAAYSTKCPKDKKADLLMYEATNKVTNTE